MPPTVGLGSRRVDVLEGVEYEKKIMGLLYDDVMKYEAALYAR